MTSWKTVYDAIENAYDASGTLRAALPGGLHNTVAPPETDYPMATVALINGTSPDTLNERFDELLIQFNVYVEEEVPDDLLTVAGKLDTVYRTCPGATGALTITGYTHHFTKFEASQIFQSDTPDLWQWNGRYRILIEQN